MSKAATKKADPQGCGKARCRMPRVRRCGIKLLRALIARKVVVILLATTVAAELAVLGVGVTRRLDMAYDRALEVSRAQLAVIEAEELAHLPDTN